jgi:hypothetical protein
MEFAMVVVLLILALGMASAALPYVAFHHTNRPRR